jgi:predicted transcriptional regulator of viral defense system
MKAATRTKRSPIYLRQLLSRWAKQGRIKRVQRGKYQKSKAANVQRMAA